MRAVTILLAHGAGAPMDSASMTATAKALAAAGFRVARFEFGYMAAAAYRPAQAAAARRNAQPGIRRGGRRLWHAKGPLIIGGKSMGGRVASMVADELLCSRQDRRAAVPRLSLPSARPSRTQLRTKHLAGLKTPTLICQGTRDEFGTRDEVAGYDLSDRIEMLWLEDGDHDLKPRKSVSGFSDRRSSEDAGRQRWRRGARAPRALIMRPA